MKRYAGTITVAAGNTPRKRQLAHPRRQARYIVRRLRGAWTRVVSAARRKRQRPAPVHSFSVCEAGNGIRRALRLKSDVRMVSPRANAIVRAAGRVLNRIGNGLASNRDLVRVVKVGWVRFPDYRDKWVTRGLFWPWVVYEVIETGERYLHCSGHAPTNSRISVYEKTRMIVKARNELEDVADEYSETDEPLPTAIGADWNWTVRMVRQALGDGWTLATRTDVMMIWVRGFDVVGVEVDTTVQGTLTDHSGVIYAALRVAT